MRVDEKKRTAVEAFRLHQNLIDKKHDGEELTILQNDFALFSRRLLAETFDIPESNARLWENSSTAEEKTKGRQEVSSIMSKVVDDAITNGHAISVRDTRAAAQILGETLGVDLGTRTWWKQAQESDHASAPEGPRVMSRDKITDRFHESWRSFA